MLRVKVLRDPDNRRDAESGWNPTVLTQRGPAPLPPVATPLYTGSQATLKAKTLSRKIMGLTAMMPTARESWIFLPEQPAEYLRI